MALTSTKLNISYSLDSTPKEFVFTDVTDYAAQSVALANITGSIKVTAPSGVTYAGQPDDVDGSVGRINQNQILVPLLSDGTPEVGSYTFTYTATDGVDTVVYTKTINFQYVKPTASIQSTYDCLSPLLETEDTTNYLYGAINPVDRFSVFAADAGANTFTLAGEKSAFVRVGDTFNIISSTANDGEYTVTSVTYDGTNTVIGVASVTDGTADGVLVTRKAQIFYPQVLGLNPVVGYSKKLETSVFYTNTHEFLYETKSFYDLGDGVSIVDSTTDSNEIDIQCDVRLCEIFCCINSKFNEYLTYKERGNKTLAEYALDQYVLATSHLSALRQAFECGKTEAVTSLTEQIKSVTNCNGDCSCDDSEPVLVTGLGGGSDTVVQSSGNGIVVSSIVAGDTTTYTLSLSQSIIDDINSITPNTTSSVISSDATVTVSSATVGSNTEYDLSVPAAVQPTELMAFDVEITPSGVGTGALVISNYSSQNLSNLQATVVGGYETTTSSDNQAFFLNTFQVSPNATYKAFIEIIENTGYVNPIYGTPTSVSYSTNGFYPEVRITQKDSGKIEFIITRGGSAFTCQGFNNVFTNVKLNVKIIE